MLYIRATCKKRCDRVAALFFLQYKYLKASGAFYPKLGLGFAKLFFSNTS
jgi:hypothetical protein